MIDYFDLVAGRREFQKVARRFTVDRITPNAAQWDEHHVYSRNVIKEVAELGVAAIYVFEKSGSIALERLEAALIMRAMAYGYSFNLIHNMAIDRFGSQTVKEKHLLSLVTINRLAN